MIMLPHFDLSSQPTTAAMADVAPAFDLATIIDRTDGADHLASVTPLQEVSWPPMMAKGLRLFIKREDLLDKGLSGNKLYKLFHYLCQARSVGIKRIISFGGVYSNHLHALALVGQQLDLEVHAIIRGDAEVALTPTLQDARAAGMTLHFVSREQYRRRNDNDFIAELEQQFSPCLIIPEGGSGRAGMEGVAAITRSINRSLNGKYDVLCVACGTGTTLAGLIAGTEAPHNSALSVLGFPVLKGDCTPMQDEVEQLLAGAATGCARWQLMTGFHGGGYAKLPQYLLNFMRDFESATAIPLDPVYTAKLLWGITNLAEQSFWPEGTRIVAVHTGGLQGRRGYPELATLVDDEINLPDRIVTPYICAREALKL